MTKLPTISSLQLQLPALVNLSADWQPRPERPDLLLSLSANNLFDVEARRHASFLKDYAPMPGLDVRLSCRLSL